MKNYYEILEVNPKASSEIINRVFRLQIKKNHPDLFNGDEQIIAENKVKEINEAYEILSDESKRKDYDTLLTEEIQKSNIYNNSLLEENKLLKEELNETKIALNEFIQSLKTNSNENISTYNDNYLDTNLNTYNENINYKKEEYFEYVIRILKDVLKKFIQILIFVFITFLFAYFFTDINILNIF